LSFISVFAVLDPATGKIVTEEFLYFRVQLRQYKLLANILSTSLSVNRRAGEKLTALVQLKLAICGSENWIDTQLSRWKHGQF
jgi:hypothetical protein